MVPDTANFVLDALWVYVVSQWQTLSNQLELKISARARFKFAQVTKIQVMGCIREECITAEIGNL